MATDRLSNALEGAQNKQMATTNQPTIFDLIQKQKPAFAMALGKAIDPERFTRIALTVVKQNPALMQCSAMSLLGALMSSAQLGLEPNILGQSYIIPYRNKGVYEAQFQIGYKGLIKLFYNSENALSITAQEVYENDKFEYAFGLNPKLIHEPVLSNRGEVIAYYAVAKLKGGAEAFAVLSKEDAKKHAMKFSKSYSSGPWVSNFDEMAKKTVIKMCLKYMPLSTERLIQLDETVKNYDEKAGIDMTEVMDSTSYEVEPEKEAINQETGEVANA